MHVRKPGILLSVFNCAHSPQLGPSKSCTSSLTQNLHCDGTRHRQYCGAERGRCYATVASEDRRGRGNRDEEDNWPIPPTGRSCPTPYQILCVKKDAAYTKTRYYELVKIYHPDRGASPLYSGISEEVKTERYRLVVSAHAILSDATKRAAYDRFGAGWEGRTETDGHGHQPGPFSQGWHRHGAADDSIWQNATWEDWERWRSNHHTSGDRPPQAPVYFKNAYFIALVGMFAIMGSSMNYNRAQDASTYFIEQRDIVHDTTVKDLRRVRAEANTRARDDRVEWFLRNREAAVETGQFGEAGLQKLRQERTAKLMAERQNCQNNESASEER